MKFPAYPKYKPSGIEWLGNVPEHWEGRRRFGWGTFFQAPTGPPNKAQGNALGYKRDLTHALTGRHNESIKSPKNVTIGRGDHRRYRALSGLEMFGPDYPGRCPGLDYFGPVGARNPRAS